MATDKNNVGGPAENTGSAATPASTSAPAVAPKPSPADEFVTKYGRTRGRAAYMRSKLPRDRQGINSFLNEFAANADQRAEMQAELTAITPEG